MLGNLRQIRRRIRSVENTKKITRAMEMVAAAKLRRFQDFLESARPYTKKMGDLLDRFLLRLPPDYDHPFLEKAAPEGTMKTAFVLFTSDTGLCGTYNSELEARAGEWLRQNPNKKISFVFVGKHGANAFHKKEGRMLASFSDLRVSRIDEVLQGLRKSLESAFLNSEVQEILVAYTQMESLSRYRPITERLLPIAKGSSAESDSNMDLVEPDAKTVLDRLLPSFFEARLRFIFYHALLTEQIARMSAMRQATQNAEEMIDELTLLRNKARQAAITKEIIEVVSGSRAQKLR